MAAVVKIDRIDPGNRHAWAPPASQPCHVLPGDRRAAIAYTLSGVSLIGFALHSDIVAVLVERGRRYEDQADGDGDCGKAGISFLKRSGVLPLR